MTYEHAYAIRTVGLKLHLFVSLCVHVFNNSLFSKVAAVYVLYNVNDFGPDTFGTSGRSTEMSLLFRVEISRML